MDSGYEIRVRYQLGPPLTFLLRDLEPRVAEAFTILRIDSTDQETLHDTLRRLSDLGLEILSVERRTEPW